MATIIPMPIPHVHDIHLLSLSMVRMARLAMMQAPNDVLAREIALIERRSQKISPQRDRKRIQQGIEGIIMSEITACFGSTSCLNCRRQAKCPQSFTEHQAGEDSEPLAVPRYELNATDRCGDYAPDWGSFNKILREHPELILQIEKIGTITLDRIRLAKHLTVVLERWAKEAGDSGTIKP